MTHPSFLALDRFALGAHQEIGPHVDSCAVCRAHVELVSTAPAELPPWVIGLKPAKPRWPRAAWLLAALVPVLALVLVMWPSEMLHGTLEPGLGRTQAKGGAPDVALWIKRGERVFVRQKDEPVQPGDRLRIEVASGGYSHVAVLSRGASGFEPLFSGELSSGATLLPKAWEVDAAEGPETIVVVLSRRPLSHAEAVAYAEGSRTSGEVWVDRLVVTKTRVGSP